MSERPWIWEEDGYTVIRGHARTGPGCHDNCGVLIYVKNGELVKVEGDPENPYNGGRLCVRCLAVRDVVYHPQRLKHPLKRVGERGENKWERISWDEAYDLIEKKFNKIKEEYGPESVVFLQGTGRDILGYISRLAYGFGSPNWSCGFLSGLACYLPRVSSCMIISGDFAVADCSQFFPDRYNNPQWKCPETMVIWGNNPLVANSDGFYGHWVIDLMKRGTKLIVIDPRLTWLASRAELWLQIRPGTDAALALGMLNIIIQEELYDKEFVNKWTYGFEDLKKRAAEYPPDRVAEITWIPQDKIIKAARMYAQSKPASIQWGLAIDMTKESTAAGHAIQCLWTITGNLDVPGGNVIGRPCWGIYQPWTGGWGYDELLTEEQKQKRLGLKEYPMLNFGFLTASPNAMVEAMVTGEPYPIKGAWIQTNNPLACMGADPQQAYNLLKKLDFVVVVDLFMTPTALAVADVVLPAATFAERPGVTGHNPYYVGAIIPAIPPHEEARSDQRIMIELGKRFNPEAFPWNSEEEMYDTILEPAGLTYQELKEKGWVYPEFEYYKYEKGLLREDGQPGFNTPTGKVELKSTLFPKWGLDPLPYFEEPPESPVSTPYLAQQYPLVLTTGARHWGLFHSEHRQIAPLRRIHPNPTLEIHPDTAAQLGIKDGDWVWVENRHGRCKQRAKVTPAIHPRVVNADHAWWFPERDPNDGTFFGTFESNPNNLIPMVCGRSGFGAPYKASLCRVYKAEGGDD